MSLEQTSTEQASPAQTSPAQTSTERASPAQTPAEQASVDPYAKAAGTVHTILLLLILGGWTVMGGFAANLMRAPTATPHRVRLYLLTIAFEWLLFLFVVEGVRRSGKPVGLVVGRRWGSAQQVLKDIGIAAAYWLISGGVLVLLVRLLHAAGVGQQVNFLLPHGATEIVLWLAVSLTAGICEETIFRGYLQRQFTAATKNAALGIILSAAAFGAAHAYQGARMTVVIGLYGAMFGILAHWRGTPRPGMMAHAWQDSLSGIVGGLVRH